MKCTTAQTLNGALEGTPFPPVWLKRFSELVPISIFNLMSRVCKRLHQHMRLNVVWRKEAKKLEEFATLTEFERHHPRPELFWYEWWCDRVVRVMPVVAPPHGMAFQDAEIGNLCTKGSNPDDSNCKILVIISEVRAPFENRKGGFSYVQSLDPLSKIRQTNTVRFKKISKYNVVIRPSGNTNINMYLLP